MIPKKRLQMLFSTLGILAGLTGCGEAHTYPANPPATPTGLAASADPSLVTISWDETRPADADIVVEESRYPDTGFKIIAHATGTTHFVEFTPAEHGTFYYRASACHRGLPDYCSPPSTSVAVAF